MDDKEAQAFDMVYVRPIKALQLEIEQSLRAKEGPGTIIIRVHTAKKAKRAALDQLYNILMKCLPKILGAAMFGELEITQEEGP
jgi:hypothetical protein